MNGEMTMFDTHAYVKKLCAVGFSEPQAEALATTHAELLQKSLVTREHLDMRLRELEYRMTIKLGSLTLVGIGVIATLVKLM